jgi:hypothetical protein
METMPMSIAVGRPGFCVRVEGSLIDPGKWLIHGTVEYRRSQAVESRSDVEAEARQELMLAITRAFRSARARGARSVYVVVEGDDEVAGFFRMLDRQTAR